MWWWVLGAVAVLALLVLVALFRRPSRRGLLCEPGEEFPLAPGRAVRVWDLFIDVAADRLTVDGREVMLSELPVQLGRFEVSAGSTADTAVVRTVPADDRSFRKRLPSFSSSDCTPLVSPEFRGLALAGPNAVPVARSIDEDWDDWVQHKVAHFVVAGSYTFDGPALAALDRDPNEAIELVIENVASGVVHRQNLEQLDAEFEHSVLGMNVSPAPREPYEAVHNAGFVSVSGYFHAHLDRFVGEPTEPFDLRVHAECGEWRSETVTIRIEP